jgi:hypothetical protein
MISIGGLSNRLAIGNTNIFIPPSNITDILESNFKENGGRKD